MDFINLGYRYIFFYFIYKPNINIIKNIISNYKWYFMCRSYPIWSIKNTKILSASGFFWHERNNCPIDVETRKLVGRLKITWTFLAKCNPMKKDTSFTNFTIFHSPIFLVLVLISPAGPVSHYSFLSHSFGIPNLGPRPMLMEFQILLLEPCLSVCLMYEYKR